jgi:uncharacterized membrane protein required for colicin V production
MWEMNSLDLTLFICIMYFGRNGFYSGFVREFISTTIIIFGILMFSYISNTFLFSNNSLLNIESSKELDIYGYLMTFSLFSIFVWVIYGHVNNVSFKIEIEFIDKLFGFIIGNIKGFFVFGFIIYFIFSISEIRIAYKEKINESYIVKKMLIYSDYIFHVKYQKTIQPRRNTSYIKDNQYDSSEDGKEQIKINEEE